MSNTWTVKDQAQLRNMAGKYPASVIAEHLGHSVNAVRIRASELGISLRYYQQRLVWCSYCAKYRTRIDSNGLCPVCVKKQRIGVLEEKHRLAERSYYARKKLSDESSMNEQLQEEERLDRQIKATQKALERIRDRT